MATGVPLEDTELQLEQVTEPEESSASSSVSTDVSDEFESALTNWNCTDPNVAKELWQQLQQATKQAASMVKACLTVARSQPRTFAEFLKLNQAPMHEFLDLSSSANETDLADKCAAVISLQLYESNYAALEEDRTKSLAEMWGLKKGNERFQKPFAKLVWMSNTVIHMLPDEFPFLIKAINHHVACISGVATPDGANHEGFHLVKKLFGRLPFKNPQAMALAFGYSRYGVRYSKEFQTVKKAVSIDEIFKVLRAVNEYYKPFFSGSETNPMEAWNESGLIDLGVASEICQNVFGLDPWFVSLINADNKCLEVLRGNREELLACWNGPKDDKHRAVRKLYNELHKQWREEKKKASKKAEDSDDETAATALLTDDEEDVSTEHDIQKGLALKLLFQEEGFGVRDKVDAKARPKWENNKKKKKRNGRKKVAFRNDIRKEAMKRAAELIRNKINTDGGHLDRQLLCGRKMWEDVVPLQQFSATEPEQRVKVDLVPLGTGGAPCVLHVSNAFSPEFLAEDERQSNATLYCQDTNSGGGSNSIGAFFQCKHCPAEDQDSGADFMSPLIRIGEHNGVCSVPASPWEKGKQAMASELINMFSHATNQILAEIRDQLQPTVDTVDEDVEETGETVDAGDETQPVDGDVMVETVDDGDETGPVDGEVMQEAPPAAVKYLTDLQVEKTVKALVGEGRGMFDLQQLSLDHLADITIQECTATISKVGNKAVFSKHQDSSYIVNSTSTHMRQCAATGHNLPLRQDMPVVTFVTGRGACQAKLSWYKGKECLGSIVTTDNSVHIQLPGVQWDNIVHESSLADKTAQRGTLVAGGCRPWRKIDTYRQTLCPRCDEEDYKAGIRLDGLGETRKESKMWGDYKWSNVCAARPTISKTPHVGKFNDGIIPGATVPSSSSVENRWTPELMKSIAPQKFRTLKGTALQNVLQEGYLDGSNNAVRPLVRPGKKIGLREKHRAVLSRHHRIVGKSLEHDCLPMIVGRTATSDEATLNDQPIFLDPGDGEAKYQDRLPLMLGQRLRYSQLPVFNSDMASCVVDGKYPMVMVLVHAYKNDPKSFRKWRQFCLRVKRLNLALDDDFELFLSLLKDMGPLVCNGFSGSMQKADLNAPTAKTMRHDDPAYIAGHPQSSTQASNAVFERIKDERRPVAVFMCESSWGEKWDDEGEFADPPSAKKSRSEPGEKEVDVECLFLGYHIIHNRLEHPEFSEEQVKERFEGMEDYLKAQALNITHLRNGFFEYVFRPAFPPSLIRKFAVWRADKKKLEVYRVWDQDKRPLSVSFPLLKEACDSAEPKINCNTITDVTHSMIFDYFQNHMTKTEFLEELSTPYDENKSLFVPPGTYENSISKEDACAIILNVSAAASMRFSRDHSVRSTEGGRLQATPLVAGESGHLPDTLRQAPLPLPNPDLDVNVQFNVCQVGKLVEHIYSEGNIEIDGKNEPVLQEHRPIAKNEDNSHSVQWHNKLSRVNEHILSQALFMLIVSRFTGDVQVLSKYDGLHVVGSHLHLPMLSQWEDFGNFLEAVQASPKFNSYKSKQHEGSLPCETKKLGRLRMLIQALATSPNGCKKVAKYIASFGLKRRDRASVMDCLTECIATCGDIQDVNEVDFVAQKVLADLETVFLGVVDAPTVDSLVLGYGSSNGIDCLNIEGETRLQKVLNFHTWLVSYLMDDRNATLRKALGWKVVGLLESSWSGRQFSLVDTEHILCKIWLAVIHSHACRNISEDKEVSVGHCYPLCEEGEWEGQLAPYIQEMWEAFLQCQEASQYPFPPALKFDEEQNLLI